MKKYEVRVRDVLAFFQDVGVHQGGGILELENTIIEKADQLGFPLFLIPPNIPYSIIFTAVYKKSK